MNDERQSGVIESRIGLAVLICLLVAFGYVVLDKLSGASQPALVELRNEPSAATSQAEAPDEQLPQVLEVHPDDHEQPPFQTTRRAVPAPDTEEHLER